MARMQNITPHIRMKLNISLNSLPSDRSFTMTFMNTPSKNTHSLCPMSHIMTVCTMKLGQIAAASFMANHEFFIVAAKDSFSFFFFSFSFIITLSIFGPGSV